MTGDSSRTRTDSYHQAGSDRADSPEQADRRGRMSVWAVVAIVLATGAGLWAADGRPFRARHCWGAWYENSGPLFLSKDAIAGPESRRQSTQSKPPSDGATEQATCDVTVTSPLKLHGGTVEVKERVSLAIGRVPAEAGARRAWMAPYLDGSASPLPDGLEGVVARDRALLVLPEACDVDGRPSAVTILSAMWKQDAGEESADPFPIGSPHQVTELLLTAADVGMEEADCAPDEPLRAESPLVVVDGPSEFADEHFDICRVSGMRFSFARDQLAYWQVGAVTGRLQTCSVTTGPRNSPQAPTAQYAMVSSPRMAALFDGLPEGVDKGLRRTKCKDRPTVFYGNADEAPGGAAVPDAATVFTHFMKAAAGRSGCPDAAGP
ncbi:hypothetical protein [Streptomyces sp. WZ.A104]|uniref:hypothetical protein n=1 Tax=Streptomyces sp. WZ.A104 TaxID=2023771 RepID=UPI00211C1BB0|nr:hypothetical protein [Streptomyces sp. WZ.A104]